MTAGDAHAELLSGFIDESIDALTAAGVLAVGLESGRYCPELIGALFRPVHSLKGNAAYFGLMKLKKLAHALESVLDILRKDEQVSDSATVTLILESIDALNRILGNVRDGHDEIDDRQAYERMIAALDLRSGKAESAHLTLHGSNEVAGILQELRSRTGNGGEPLVAQLERLLFGKNEHAAERPGDNRSGVTRDDHAGEMYSAVRELVREDGNFPLAPEMIVRMEELLQSLRHTVSAEPGVKILDEIDDVFRTFAASESGIDALAAELLRTLIDRLAASERSAGTTAVGSDAPSRGAVEEREHAVKSEKTMRIPEQTLDEFLYSVGELLGIEEMLRYLLRIIQNGADIDQISRSLKEAVNQFSVTSKELRVKIMAVRKVEARILLQKSLRVVRDIALQANKRITTVVIGEELKIDKSYLELLDAPLTHMVRNAADHGIEPPQVREAAGKKPEGTITVALSENAETLKLEVKDDGAGINRDALLQKGIELGVFRKETPVTQDALIDLLFRSGVSTAQTVTEISGRGVGMDIVRQAVGNAGGTITLDSTPGNGTAIAITVPRNAATQILDGYIVKAFSGELYVFPLPNVVDAFVIEPHTINRIAGRRRTVMHHGTVIPMYMIDTVLSRSSAKRLSTAATKQLMGIVTEWKDNRVVFAVDELMGIQKVVCKPVDKRIIRSSLFDGAAISGTGQISMILNIEQLFSDIGKKK